MSTKRTLKTEWHQYGNAIHLLELGARVPVVVEMTHLSNWYLRKLSLEIRGEPPCKGQLPNSEIWYLKKQNNLHASLFTVIYDKVLQQAQEHMDLCHLLVAAYRIYCQQVEAAELKVLLSVDRAWGLVKSLQHRHLKRCRCRQCQGSFVANNSRLESQFVCWGCRENQAVERLLKLPIPKVLS